MGQPEKPPKKDFVTKEIFIMMTPVLASYLWTIFYEAGYARYYGIPFDFIDLKVTDILLTNRLTLLAATLAFLWIGLYYNLLPSATSALFKGVITLLLIVSISLGSLFGWLDAVTKTDYFVLTSAATDTAVLKIYGDTVVTAPFDRLHKTVYKSFGVLKIGDGYDLQLTLQSVGPLVPQTRK